MFIINNLQKKIILLFIYNLILFFKLYEFNKMTVKYYKNQGHNCYFIEDNGTNEKQISVMTFYKYSKKGKFYGRTNYFLFFGEQGDLYYLKENKARKCTSLVYHSGRFIKDLTIEDGNVKEYLPMIGTDYNQKSYCLIILNCSNSSTFVFKNKDDKLFSREVDTFYLSREFDKIGLFPYPNQVIFEEDEEVKKKLWENCSNSAKEYKKAQFEEIND